MPTSAIGRAVAKRAQRWLDAPLAEINDATGSTSESVRAAVQKAMSDHLCDHYTRRPGIAPLCKAVAAELSSRGLATVTDDVVITGGVAEARYVAIQTLSTGKPVFVHHPRMDAVKAILALTNAEPQPLDLADLPDAPGALLVVDSATVSGDERAQLAEWAAAHDVTVIADESDTSIFSDATYQPFAAQPGLAERTLTLGGFSAAPGLAAWSVGWFSGPKALSAKVRDLKQAMTISSPAPAQYAALAALSELKESAV